MKKTRYGRDAKKEHQREKQEKERQLGKTQVRRGTARGGSRKGQGNLISDEACGKLKREGK